MIQEIEKVVNPVVPFGKYKGQTIIDLMTTDPKYVEWLQAQTWFVQKFAELHAALMNRGVQSDDSPEHNAIQARFLDPTFTAALVRLHLGADMIDEIDLIRKKLKADVFVQHSLESPIVHNYVVFEENAIDVTIKSYICWSEALSYLPHEYEITIEIKPTFGDDYPTILRQMKRLKCRILVANDYNGVAVTESEMKQMFEASYYSVYFIRQIEEEMQNPTFDLQFSKSIKPE